MTNDLFEYDVALSFAGEDRAAAEEFAGLLKSRNLTVLYDEYKAEDAERWGKDVLDHLVNLYARKARYCVLLVSRHYPLKAWTRAERASATERGLRDADEYILPVRLDESDVPGITEAAGYRDLRRHSVESIVDLLEARLQRKLREMEDRSGPPSRSHDLRSGNIPSTGEKP